jgi:predicted transcriptional regulator
MQIEMRTSPRIPQRPYVTEILSAPYDQKSSITLKNIAWETGISRSDIKNIVTCIRKGYRGAVTVADILPDPYSMEEEVERQNLFEYVVQTIQNFHIPYALNVLLLRRTKELTYGEIGKRLGISEEKARIIDHKTVAKVQEYINRLDASKEIYGNMIY